MDSSTKILHIASNACNDDKLTTFTTARLRELIYLEIDSWNFKTVTTFDIRNNHNLEYVNIKSNSYTDRHLHSFYYEHNDDKSASFRIVNCGGLRSIKIGKYSFANYGGIFELSNLASLESIKIGELNFFSYNFYSSSLVIRGKSLLRLYYG